MYERSRKRQTAGTRASSTVHPATRPKPGKQPPGEHAALMVQMRPNQDCVKSWSGSGNNSRFPVSPVASQDPWPGSVSFRRRARAKALRFSRFERSSCANRSRRSGRGVFWLCCLCGPPGIEVVPRSLGSERCPSIHQGKRVRLRQQPFRCGKHLNSGALDGHSLTLQADFNRPTG